MRLREGDVTAYREVLTGYFLKEILRQEVFLILRIKADMISHYHIHNDIVGVAYHPNPDSPTG